jgi:hypothetical protein
MIPVLLPMIAGATDIISEIRVAVSKNRRCTTNENVMS